MKVRRGKYRDCTTGYGLEYKFHGLNTGLIFPKIHAFYGFEEKEIQAFGNIIVDSRPNNFIGSLRFSQY